MGSDAGISFESSFPKRVTPAYGEGRTLLEVPPARRQAPAAKKQEYLEYLIREIMGLDSCGLMIDARTVRGLWRFFDALYLDEDGRLDFRHQYAGISCVLYSEMEATESDGLLVEAPRSFANLTNGLDQIMVAFRRERSRLFAECQDRACTDGIVTDQMERISTILASLGKLSDHISLETRRIEYIVKQNRASEEARRGLERAVAERQKQLVEFDGKLTETQEKVSRDNIGVLGVFSAIVLAFNGGISFSTSSLQAIGDGRGVLPVLLTVDLVGFVLLNSVGLLLTFVWRMSLGKGLSLGRFPWCAWIAADITLIVFATLIIWCPQLFPVVP